MKLSELDVHKQNDSTLKINSKKYPTAGPQSKKSQKMKDTGAHYPEHQVTAYF